jgi:hypothetical protein
MQWLIQNREQLWAEAMHRLIGGHRFWELPEAEQRMAEEEQEQRMVEDGFTDPVAQLLARAYLENPVDRPLVVTLQKRECYCYTNTQLYDHLDVPLERRQGLSRRLSVLIAKIGGGKWSRQIVRFNGITARGFVLDKIEADKQPRVKMHLPKY